MTSRWQAWGELDPRVWRMAVARTINTMGLSLVMAFLGVYMVEERGYPAWAYGVVAMIANLGQSFTNAWAGNLSDRIGRRPLITGGLLVRAFVIGGLGVQILLDAPLWSLALNVLVSSALRGCFEPVAYALVTDVCTPAQRISAFGLQRMGTNLGWAVGPAMGGVLSLWLPYGVVFFVAGGGLLIAAWVTTHVEDPVHAQAPRVANAETAGGGAARAPVPDADADNSLTHSLRTALRDRTMIWLMVGTFFAALLQTQLFSTFSIYMSDGVGLTKAQVGLIYTFNGAAVVLLQLPALALIRQHGHQRFLMLAPLLTGLGFALVGAATGFAGGAMAIVVVTCGEVLFDPSHQTAIAAIADPAHRGRAYGVVGFSQMIGVAMAPLVGGGLYDLIGHHHAIMWGCLGSIGIVQALVFRGFVRSRSA